MHETTAENDVCIQIQQQQQIMIIIIAVDRLLLEWFEITGCKFFGTGGLVYKTTS